MQDAGRVVKARSKSGGTKQRFQENERECTRILALLACEQLATFAGVPFSFDPQTGPTALGQLARNRMVRVAHFKGTDEYVAWRLAWEIWTGTNTRRAETLQPIVGRGSLAEMSPDGRNVVRRILDVLRADGFDSAAGVPL